MTNHLKYGHECEVCRPLRPVTSPITGPMLGRREFLKVAGVGTIGTVSLPLLRPEARATAIDPNLNGKARNCILVFLNGAPSHVDTFDLKVGAWTPADFNPTTYNGVLFPQGLMPNLAEQINRFAILRSVRAPALVHSLQQAWVQIARSPVTQMGKISPHIGSVVAYEFEQRRQPHQKLPVFISINGTANGPGYFAGQFAAFNMNASSNGLGSLTHSDGQTRFEARYNMLKAVDNSLRDDSLLGNEVSAMSGFYDRSKGMMYNAEVDAIFKYNTTESQRFGSTSFGNACIVARNLLKSDQGTRFIQLNLGGWDNHANIYATNGGIYTPARALDRGLATLMTDLAAAPGKNGGSLLDETIIVAMGEFGRTIGPLTAQGGRDHFFQQFAFVAGGGVVGGRVIGSTTADGRSIQETGWSQNRPIANEDIAATIYSALGINYLKTLHDDPFGRGFDYVPFANDGYWAPVTELFDRGLGVKSRTSPSRTSSSRGRG